MARAAGPRIGRANLFYIILLGALQGSVADGQWDAALSVSVTPFPVSTALRLENMDMERVLLYPPNSPFPFLPAAYRAPTTPALLTLSNCSISTLCSTVQAYALLTAANPQPAVTATPNANSNLDASMLDNYTLLISAFTSTSLVFNTSLVNVTIRCDAGDAIQSEPAHSTANSSSNLLEAFTAMSIVNVTSGNTLQLQGVLHTNLTRGWPATGVFLGPGTLNMSSVPGHRAVLDMDMNMNMINVQTGPIHLAGLTLVNLCTSKIVVKGYAVYWSFGLNAFHPPDTNWGQANTSDKPLTVRNSTLVIPRIEMYSLMYWTAIYPSPFAKINTYAAVFVNTYPNNPPQGIALGKDDLLISMVYDSLTFKDVILHAADAPYPQEVCNVTFQLPTLCTTDPGPKPLIDASILQNDILNPMYPIASTHDLTAALMAAGSRIFQFPPQIMLFQTIAISASSSGLTFSSDVVIAGPSAKANVSAGSATNATLDLQQMTAASITLTGADVGLYLQRLSVINSPEASVGSIGSIDAVSALPLWGFKFNRSNATRITMDSVTLVLPVSSFAPLYALAKAGGPSMLADARQGAMQGWSALAHPVLDKIAVFATKQYSTSAIALSSYAGWGINATNLLILPASPYTDDQPDAPDSSSSRSDTVRIVVIVVLTVFLFIVLVAVGFAAFWYRRKQRMTLLTSTDSRDSLSQKVPMPASTACCPARPETGPNPSSLGSVCGTNSKSVTIDGLSSTGCWDPMKEVQQYAGLVQPKDEDSLQLLEPIGTGGFGTVYHGRWRNLDVAVKTVLFTCKDGSPDAPERVAIKEAAVCSSIIHPNVVATFHYDIRPVQAMLPEGAMLIQDHVQPRDWKMYLVQELCHSSLADALASSFFHHQGSNLPNLDLILCSLLDIAKGLEYIHGKNIIHGDLKPENVLLKVEPNNAHGVISKITDFGLCSTLDPTKSHVSCFNGTPFYAAPEIAATGKTTKLSDVFSFGILMVEVYRRETPWIRTPHGFQPNDAFLVFHEQVPAAYLALVDCCLQHDPKKRPELTQIREALQAILAQAQAAGGQVAA